MRSFTRPADPPGSISWGLGAIVTDNLKHFRQIKGLSIENWIRSNRTLSI